MPDFQPFRGYRFSADLTNRLSQILSPPYDKVSRQQLPALWESDPLNAVRLILPPPDVATGDFMTESATEDGADWYEGARRYLDDWIRQGILKRDERAFYYYRQDFLLDGVSHTRWGVIGALGLEEKGETLLHERTFEGPKADRLRLMKATEANLGCIFMIATDPQGSLLQVAERLESPAVDCRTPEGDRHRVYLVTQPDAVQTTVSTMKDATFMIADGHHRYETARNYQAWLRQNGQLGPDSPANALMVYVAPVQQQGLVILPTHRVVRRLGVGWLDRPAEVDSIECRPVPGRLSDLMNELSRLSADDVALAATDGRKQALLVRKGEPDPALYEGVDPALRNLDVTFLHQVVLNRVLEVPEDAPGRISYFRDPQEALALVKESHSSGAFFLRSPEPERVIEVSKSGHRMPPKSTDFYPKVPAGLVIRLLREPPKA